MHSKYFLFLPTMADQTQRVGEAHVLDENWPSQLVGFPEAVTLCQLCGFQSNNKKTHWGHSSRKTRSLFWGIHHKIPLCQKKGQLSLQRHLWRKPLGVQGANLSTLLACFQISY